ncbi:MAG: hypothetical protein ACI828_000894, partial [Flavobacteriales bacterium]
RKTQRIPPLRIKSLFDYYNYKKHNDTHCSCAILGRFYANKISPSSTQKRMSTVGVIYLKFYTTISRPNFC